MRKGEIVTYTGTRKELQMTFHPKPHKEESGVKHLTKKPKVSATI